MQQAHMQSAQPVNIPHSRHSVLSGLGVRIVVVVGSQQQIDTMIRERGGEPHYETGYRVTDRDTLRIAIEAAGQVRTACEQFLSKVGGGVQ